MADMTLGGGMPSFKFPCTVSPAIARDDAFWRVHAAWRAAEEEWEVLHLDDDLEDPFSEALFELAEERRRAMFRHPASTATAILAKFDAWREVGFTEWTQPGDGIGDLIERDLRTLAGIEAAG